MNFDGAKNVDHSDPLVDVLNSGGQGRVVLLCEHASRWIPDEHDGLGLDAEGLTSHAAWDLGALELSIALAKALDGVLVTSKASRLVYDCNRPPEDPGAMRDQSELISVPGNIDLSQEDRDARIRSVYEPFCSAVDGVLDKRSSDTVVVTVHTFTPVYFGKYRSVEIGLLHDDDSRLVDAMLTHTDKLPGVIVARNEPYGPQDGVTHSLKIHAGRRGLPNVMIEIRNDLVRSAKQVEQVAQQILALLLPALEQIESKDTFNE